MRSCSGSGSCQLPILYKPADRDGPDALIGFFSATQDIAVDAGVSKRRTCRGRGPCCRLNGDTGRPCSWRAPCPCFWRGATADVSYAVMAALMSVGVIAVLASTEAERATRPVHGPHFPAAFVDPWRDFFARYGSAAALILALVCVHPYPSWCGTS